MFVTVACTAAGIDYLRDELSGCYAWTVTVTIGVRGRGCGKARGWVRTDGGRDPGRPRDKGL